jgi:hypothetical protein
VGDVRLAFEALDGVERLREIPVKRNQAGALDGQVDDRRGPGSGLGEVIDARDPRLEGRRPNEGLAGTRRQPPERGPFALAEPLRHQRVVASLAGASGRDLPGEFGGEAGDVPGNRDVQAVHARVEGREGQKAVDNKWFEGPTRTPETNTMTKAAGGLTVLVLLAVVAATGGVAAVQPPTQVDIDADSVALHADVTADGDAVWTVAYRIRLDDENATAAFEELQADIESDPAPYLDPFRQRMERTAAGAENATGRQMAIENVTVETRRESQPQVEYGVVTYRLEWSNFAAVDGETVRAGDAVDRLFLDPETSLRLTAPDGYVVDSATPDPERAEPTEVVWWGQRDFDAGEPRAVFVPEGESPAGTPPADDETDTPTASSASGDDGGFPVLAILALLVLFVAAGAWIASRGEVTLPVGGGDGDGAEATEAAGEGGPPPELLSNEERLLQLLEEHGGRMKQKEVAERLDWTAAKTSQIVGDLRDEGELDSFRLGRENVLTLPGVDIDAADDDSQDE